MKRFTVLLAMSFALVAASSAMANPLNLVLNDHPDITSNFIDVSYNSSTNVMDILGYNIVIDDDGVGPLVDFDDFGSWAISAIVDEFGVASSGTLTITGDVLGNNGVLLTGNLVDFGWTKVGADRFEFIFSATGGLLATSQYFGVPGTPVGVIFDTFEDIFDGTWNDDFANEAGGPFAVADTAPLPEPSTLSVLLLAAGLAGMKRRR